jgi:hypothetical protein
MPAAATATTVSRPAPAEDQSPASSERPLPQEAEPVVTAPPEPARAATADAQDTAVARMPKETTPAIDDVATEGVTKAAPAVSTEVDQGETEAPGRAPALPEEVRAAHRTDPVDSVSSVAHVAVAATVADSTAAPASVACPTCGTGLPADARFCGVCGNSLDTTRSPQSQAAAPQPVAPVAPTFAPAAVAPLMAAAAPGGFPAGGSAPPVAGGDLPSDMLFLRVMVTPRIAQAFFWVSEVANLLFWVNFMIRGGLPVPFAGNNANAWAVIGGLLGLAVGAAVIRVFFEVAVVVFELRDSLASRRTPS